MKKIILALSLASVTMMAGAQITGVVEYDYDRVAGAKSHSNYVASGLIFNTKYGNFDGYLQGVSVYTNGIRDNSGGIEVGYSKQIAVGSITLSPRVAYGTLNGITGTKLVKYMLYSAEVSSHINAKTSGFVGLSHMNGMTSSAIPSINRMLIGADYALSEKLSARVAYSHKWYQGQNANGIMTSLAYSF